MNMQELIALSKEYRELKRLAEEAQTEAEGIADKIKLIMGDAEKIIAGEYKICYSTVTSNRIDTTALKQELPDIAQRFSKTSVTRRFTVA